MGMGIGINDTAPDEGRIKGKQESVACSVWFTSTGRIMPKLMKYKEKNGEIIPAYEFECDALVEKKLKTFRLHYYIERQEWKVIW